uniref:receptor protein-tyrosine kinase n=1 Tax=Scleropages formosus TaxID=113540 RepID=A0A8C9T7K4_SCLFO
MYLFLYSYLNLLLQPHRRPPVIRLNSQVLQVPEVVVAPGTRLVMSCDGDGSTHWVTSAACPRNQRRSLIEISRATVKCTGTYMCVFDSRKDFFTSVHVYVNDPNNLFVPMRGTVRLDKKEGENCLLECLLTDPSATDLSLLMKNGTSPPPGMNYTADPRKGVLIRNLQPSYSADYVCSAQIGGVEKRSQPFSVEVSQNIHVPPVVSLETREHVRAAGEQLKLACAARNPNIRFTVKWKHQSNNQKISRDNNGVTIHNTLTIPAVKVSDTGNFTCQSINEAGNTNSTTFLRVVERYYVRLSPQLPSTLIRNGTTVTAKEEEDVELKVLVDAYPQIQQSGWTTPVSHNISMQESFLQDYNKYEAGLLLRRIKVKERGQYTFYASNSHVISSVTFSISIYKKPSTVLRKENSTTFTCTSSGYPAPTVCWYQCSGIRTTCRENDTEPLSAQVEETSEEGEEGSVTVKSVLTLEHTNHAVTVECVALNLVGEAHDTVVSEASYWSAMFIPILIGIASLASLLLLLLIITLYKYKQKPRYEIRWKIIETSDGTSFIDPTQLPYNKNLEFPRDKLKLGKVLGAGAFGKVVEATAYGLGKEGNAMRVAVKMLKPTARVDEKEALMSELKILSHLGHHENIVNLLGACTHGGPVLMITEYCCHGDLQNFLRNKAETILNLVMSMQDIQKSDYKNVYTKRISVIRSDSGTAADSHVLQSRPGSSCEEAEVDSWPLDIDDLLRFSYQVAQGLEFLASKNCIHRDVAARNVLLADCRVAKICDFGLARDIMNDSNYVVKGNARLPVKWMAPESIFDCVYTVQSDVWSYGVLLWEIFSLGKNPYPGIPVDTTFYEMIRDGYQMSPPEFAPQEIYTIIKMCWDLEPTRRPTFQYIVQLMKSFLNDHSVQIYQNEPRVVLDQDSGSCDAPTGRDRPSDLTRNQEEGPLLTKSNNYQFC